MSSVPLACLGLFILSACVLAGCTNRGHAIAFVNRDPATAWATEQVLLNGAVLHSEPNLQLAPNGAMSFRPVDLQPTENTISIRAKDVGGKEQVSSWTIATPNEPKLTKGWNWSIQVTRNPDGTIIWTISPLPDER